MSVQYEELVDYEDLTLLPEIPRRTSYMRSSNQNAQLAVQKLKEMELSDDPVHQPVLLGITPSSTTTYRNEHQFVGCTCKGWAEAGYRKGTGYFYINKFKAHIATVCAPPDLILVGTVHKARSFQQYVIFPHHYPGIDDFPYRYGREPLSQAIKGGWLLGTVSQRGQRKFLQHYSSKADALIKAQSILERESTKGYRVEYADESMEMRQGATVSLKTMSLDIFNKAELAKKSRDLPRLLDTIAEIDEALGTIDLLRAVRVDLEQAVERRRKAITT